MFADVAQQVEHFLGKEEASSSNLPISSITPQTCSVVFLFVFADVPSHALGGVRNFVARLRAQRVEHGLVSFATCGKLRKRSTVQICPSAPKEKTTLDWVVFSFSAGLSQLRCSATSPSRWAFATLGNSSNCWAFASLSYISISLGFRNCVVGAIFPTDICLIANKLSAMNV